MTGAPAAAGATPPRSGHPERRLSLVRAALLIVALGMLVLDLLLWQRFVVGQTEAHGYLAQTDFVNWFAATRLLATGHGDQIFNIAAHQAVEDALTAPYRQVGEGLIYHYWPVLAGLLLPVAGGLPETALALWVALGALAYTAALVVLARGVRFSTGDGWLFGLAAWGFLPHIWDLELGQTSGLLCLPLALGLLALRRGADWQAGLWLGLLFLKPQLAPIWIVALLAARRWRALAGCAITGLLLIAASTALAGPGWISAWLGLSREVLSQTSGHGFDPVYSFNLKSLFALLPGVGATGANTLQTGLAVLLAALVGVLWWRIPAPVVAAPPGARLIALTILAMLLASPTLISHDLTFWAVAGAFVLAGLPAEMRPGARWIWMAICWFGWLLAWPALALFYFSPIKITALYMLAVGGGLLLTLLRTRRARADAHSMLAPVQ